MTTETLTAERNLDGWHVIDARGGVWWPNEAAREDIETADDPAAEALRLCRDHPMTGEWRT